MVIIFLFYTLGLGFFSIFFTCKKFFFVYTTC
nr:MAG TPA: Photosystem Q(B) protein [Caudoviricetes sp.]